MSGKNLRALRPGAPDLPTQLEEMLALIRAEFAYMDGRVDPPSSMHRLTGRALEAHLAAGGEILVIGRPVRACVMLTPRPPALYLGKLAVAAAARGKGLARALVAEAEVRAAALGLTALELQTRVELVENHAAFRALGFIEAGESRHVGHARTTSLLFRRPVAGPGAGAEAETQRAGP